MTLKKVTILGISTSPPKGNTQKPFEIFDEHKAAPDSTSPTTTDLHQPN